MLVTGSNHITFDVDVTGTASKPLVRCILGGDTATLFTAQHVVGTTWEASILVPPDLVGEVPFKIEVQLNGRLFTPINRTIDINRSDMNVNVYVHDKTPVAEAPKPAPVAEAPKPAPVAEAPKPAPVKRTFAANEVKQEPSIASLLAQVQNFQHTKDPVSAAPAINVKKANAPTKLKELANKPRAPKPRVVQHVSTSLADIAALHEIKATPVIVSAQPAPVQHHHTPITIKKGEVKYL